MAAGTRERLIEAATVLFYREGFRSVGLDQVLGDVGITKTAFYKHFESKDDLMVEALNRQNVWLQNHFLQTIREHGGTSARGQLLSLFQAIEQIMNEPGYHGCIFISAIMEFPQPYDPAHLAAVENRRAIERIIVEIAERARASDPEALAKEVCLIIEGAFVSQQLTRDTASLAAARRLVESVVDRYLPAESVVAGDFISRTHSRVGESPG
ncbi:TetR/AcrR family transcriptional regulator [Humisphaera borealis]|uniref:TetR family transcriptional regulator n=1 Tax=Humisphaera borealis TaxID=2807512 RepID=A0A7M2WTM2_9BACT|nr:TetR family transcriptional regulator [Humisphaera borealis]QOV88789.1 TetR family transcriptional regulator [Humisphaera borealis]